MAWSQIDQNIFSQKRMIVEKGFGTTLLPQVVLIFSRKPIWSSISLNEVVIGVAYKLLELHF